uniref:Murine leukemia virus integrase C-terminal domain-containing protein n=1 Tax=Hucho hucho TaxID=62062 RepID=A0A4W5RP82_9TELE
MTDRQIDLTLAQVEHLEYMKELTTIPRWMGPFKVTMATPTAVRVQERSGWHHLSHCQKVFKPRLEHDRTSLERPENIQYITKVSTPLTFL